MKSISDFLDIDVTLFEKTGAFNAILGVVSKKLMELNNSIDINPTALYYSLKSEIALNPESKETELTL